MKDLKRIAATNNEVARLQSNLEVWAQSVKLDGVNDGILLRDIALTAGATNLVEHRLNREPRGYFAMPKSSSIIWSLQDDNVFKTKSLALDCSADVIADLWVF